MADSDIKVWRGGASIQTQLDTQTFAGATWDGVGAGVTYTMTDSAGTTQAVVVDIPASTALTDVRNLVLAALQVSSQTMFFAVTWASSSTDLITGTAKVGGVPFTLTVAETDTGAGVSLANATTTKSQGPNDWNCDSGAGYTVSNWVGFDGAATTKPSANTNIVNILPHQTNVDGAGHPVSYSILYGLNQSAVTVQELHVPQAFKGSVGDAVNQYYLRLIVTGTGTNGFTEINTTAPNILLSGAHSEINAQQTNASSLNALKIAGGTIAKLNLLGPGVNGRITVADSCVLTAYVAQGIGADVRIGTSATAITTAVINGGTHTINRTMTTVTSAGGTVYSYGPDGAVGTCTTWNNHGATVYCNGPGDVGSGTTNGIKNYSGTFDLRQNRSFDDVDVYGAECWAGSIIDVGGLANIVYVNNPIRHGGSVQIASGTVTYV